MAYQLTEADKRWNRFVSLTCEWNLNELNPVQRTAYLCFWYDAEVNNGGHGQFFDNLPELDKAEVASALAAAGGEEIADNFRSAVATGDQDDYAQVDDVFYSFQPDLGSRLMAYVEDHQAEIFAE